MGLEISKRYSYSFHPMSAKVYEDIGYHAGIQATLYYISWQISQVLKILWHCQILHGQWENVQVQNG